ncbi:NmrA family NAD(P)-binding protein [Occultella gossypii]|uniref:NmrA family NAD(P)-binding protein n=1 Tax=Occultella gossypii TaxID=2800820 RepID=A0ABS7S966_9MICO|nr:NmrA family NAD(P)-binding protein [Occultella gossypii]MBZ2196889.1 NmrA family NAD(P)-binding protein [Occultella gossypii]
MFVITGATGRVGSAAANALLDAGAPVRVLVRSAEAAEGWRNRGADAVRVDLRDRRSLTEALQGSAGLFALLPFDPTADDIHAHTQALVASIAWAVRASRVPHVAMLSSGGADLASGTGPIASLYALEQALTQTGAILSAIRSGHFQEKVGDLVGVARVEGVYPVFADSAEVATPMVATSDVGRVAARALLSPPPISEAIDVIGPEYTERDVAGVLGELLGRRLEVVTLPRADWVPALVQAGLPAAAAELLAELHDADQHGLLAPRGDRTERGATGLRPTIARLVGVAG